MLAVPLLKGRIRSHQCIGSVILHSRRLTGGNDKSPRKPRHAQRVEDDSGKADSKEVEDRNESAENAGPSLYEQLFPDQHEAEIKKQRESEVPRLPIETRAPRPSAPRARRRRDVDADEDAERSPASRQLKREMASQGAETTVLVLRNASKNLLEEDFKRIIPQGKHLPGWTLEKGDILRVVPGRNLDTLEQTSYYYILFSSALSAFTYQGHATRIHRIVASHTPESIHSAIPPPPGFMIDGMDAHAAIESFTLVPPTQSVDLRQLKPPLAPIVEQIIRCKGYAKLVKRKDRLPYEARLTFDGPQLHMNAIRHILLTSAKARGLAWSGGESSVPNLIKWEPRESRSVDDEPHSEMKHASSQEHESKAKLKSEADQQKRRTLPLVYVVGFHTERAMQSFVHYWHRRPMEFETDKRNRSEAAELPSIANVEVLW